MTIHSLNFRVELNKRVNLRLVTDSRVHSSLFINIIKFNLLEKTESYFLGGGGRQGKGDRELEG